MQADHRRLFVPPLANGRSLRAGEALFHAGDSVIQLALVTQGCVHLLRRTAAGGTVILQIADVGDVVAEASLYSAVYHCSAEATCATEVALLPLRRFRQALRDDGDVAEAWARHLAQSVQSARMRAEIRTLRTVAERLDAWLDAGGVLPRSGHLQRVAAEIGVSREAFYRELARRH